MQLLHAGAGVVLRLALAILTILLICSAGAVAAERRVALIIGNGAYKSVIKLPNPRNDAQSMSEALADVGFESIIKVDTTRRELYQAINDFADRIAADPESVGLFYYAGHGVQANGKNYLIPVDADIQTESDLEAEAVDAGKVLRAMSEARNRMNIVILDACRNNPLHKARSAARGLMPVTAPSGTYIAYSAAPGEVALDGDPGGNGIFTGALIAAIRGPGAPIESVMKTATKSVQERTNKKQTPWIEASITGDFYFRPLGTPPSESASTPPEPSPAVQAPHNSAAYELTFWQSIANSTDPADFEDYMKRFPKGQFTNLAERRIAFLRKKSASQTAPAPAQPSTASDEASLWSRIKNSANKQDYKDYLAQYPNGRYSEIARNRLKEKPAVDRDQSTGTSRPSPSSSSEASVAPPNASSTSPRCRDLKTRLSMGEELSAGENQFVMKNCF